MKYLNKIIVAIVLAVSVTVSLAIAASGLLASGKYTAASTLTQIMGRADNSRYMTVEIIPTAVSGAAVVINRIDGLDAAGNSWPLCSPLAITSAVPTTTQIIHIGPGLTPVTASASGVTCSVPVPDKWRVNILNSAASGVTTAITESIYYSTSP